MALLAAVLLASCGSDASGPAPSSDAALHVVTTFLPITEFTKAVAGTCATVEALMPTTVSPHDFQATPGDLVRLQKADVLVKNGLGLETFLDKLIVNADNSGLQVIDSSAGIPTLENTEKDAKDPDHADGHDHGHDHGPINPHVWLDPLRAVQQVDTIRDGLIAAKPDCAEQFSANAAAFVDELRSLNAELASQLKPFAGKTFVAYHDFAPYFAERYQLKVAFVVESPELNPTPADLQRVSQLVEQTELKTLLSEPQEGRQSFNALAADLGVKIGVFDPLETGPAEAGKPGYYLSQMRRNGKALAAAFAP
ncbi:zinc ABC transporter substrate-binding protein [Synechococcus sp. CS-602]|nr:zinc transporter substrate-binding protein [Synechococcus sp. SynAce01]MCT0201656.1 zinc ABC transporter substrate-binding protein [Synechococcus sp. CS-603]MCT0203523.1 zinc ABC transporter substrate-binding protein [Synechococcus sp. CS-602]MCT0246253.1 zinc ABC transporter substrate-binding protein [Synechococcus sp. CS-601]TWB87189.1 zinc/manganese transport system substrate-binding protein [Synechococcus sp. Ace-Pa]